MRCRVSKCHGLTVVRPRKIFLTLAQNPEIFMRKLRMYAFTLLFYVFFFMILTYYVIFSVIFALFLAQNFQKLSFDCAKASNFGMSNAVSAEPWLKTPCVWIQTSCQTLGGFSSWWLFCATRWSNHAKSLILPSNWTAFHYKYCVVLMKQGGGPS